MSWQTWILTIHNLRIRRTTLLAWSLSLGLTMVAFVAMYPSIEKIDLTKLASQYPEELLRAFGIESLDALSTVGGFLDLELFGAMLPLALIFLPVGMIVSAIAANEERGYLVPLLALPIHRRAVVAGSAASALIAQLLAIAVIIGSSLATSLAVGAGLTFGEILGSALATLPLGALAGAIATIVAGATARRGLATAVAAGTIFAMYLLEVLSSFSSLAHDLRFLSVFNYYSEWIDSGIAWAPFVAILSLSAVLMIVGGGLFARRDVT